MGRKVKFVDMYIFLWEMQLALATYIPRASEDDMPHLVDQLFKMSANEKKITRIDKSTSI